MRVTYDKKSGFLFHTPKRYCPVAGGCDRKQAGVAGDRTFKEVASEKSIVASASGHGAPGFWVSGVRERYQSLGERRASRHAICARMAEGS